MDEEVQPSMKYDNQRELLCAASLSHPIYHDLLKDIPEDDIENICSGMTPRQREKREKILDYLRWVPMGLLIIVGAAGTGKPTWISRLALLFIASRKARVMVSPTTTAATNLTCSADDLDKLTTRVGLTTRVSLTTRVEC